MNLKEINKPRLVFSDFDGTLTNGEELQVEFFKIINLLKENNIPLVIVTGRSKSWAHFLITHFDYINDVISEGGGVWSKKEEFLTDDILIDKMNVKRLNLVTKELKRKFKGMILSADSFGRETDRAIELPWLKNNPKDFIKIKEFLEKENINYSISNVHLNFWSGNISKANGVSHFLKNKYNNSIKIEDCLFFGDAPNDQTLFKLIPQSIGVTNLNNFKDVLNDFPSIILEGEKNIGPNGVYNSLVEILK